MRWPYRGGGTCAYYTADQRFGPLLEDPARASLVRWICCRSSAAVSASGSAAVLVLLCRPAALAVEEAAREDTDDTRRTSRRSNKRGVWRESKNELGTGSRASASWTGGGGGGTGGIDILIQSCTPRIYSLTTPLFTGQMQAHQSKNCGGECMSTEEGVCYNILELVVRGCFRATQAHLLKLMTVNIQHMYYDMHFADSYKIRALTQEHTWPALRGRKGVGGIRRYVVPAAGVAQRGTANDQRHGSRPGR